MCFSNRQSPFVGPAILLEASFTALSLNKIFRRAVNALNCVVSLADNNSSSQLAASTSPSTLSTSTSLSKFLGLLKDRYSMRRGVRAVHGDDFVSEGELCDLKWMDQQLQFHFEIKTEIIGAHERLAKEAKLLNRIIHWKHDALYWKPDPRHVELTLQYLHLDDGRAKPTVAPGVKVESNARRGKEVKDGDEEIMEVCSECGYAHAYGEEPVEGCSGIFEGDLGSWCDSHPSGQQDFLENAELIALSYRKLGSRRSTETREEEACRIHGSKLELNKAMVDDGWEKAGGKR